MTRRFSRKIIGIVALFFSLAVLRPVAGAAGPYVWIEGEKPTRTNVPPNLNGWGHKEFLSGGAWLNYSIDEGQVAKVVPAEGILISYDFTAPADGKYAVWNRIALDSISSPFDWRIDGGPWTTMPHGAPTIDLMDINDFCEVSWLNLGQATLTKGGHTIEIRILPQKDAQGHVQRIIYGCDALCLAQGEWTPFSHFKPGEDSQTPADMAAGKKVFDLPDPAGPGQRSQVELAGTWEIARAAEDFYGKVDEPMKLSDLPADAHWMAINVPSNKNDRPDLIMAHRFVYRTRVNLPASAAGHSIFITFPSNNLNTTVFCNGVYCGFNKNPLAQFAIDLTAAAKPGQVNVIEVALRDYWYGYQTDVNDPNLWFHFRIPTGILSGGWQSLIYPIWGHTESGILNTPVLTMAGSAYVSDTFVKTSVAKHELTADVTLENPSAQPIAGQVVCEAIDAKTGAVAKTLPAEPFKVAPGQEQMVELSDAWANPTLWWPDDPHLYTLRTTVQIAGQPADISDQPFGFREWTIDGIHFKLNGIIFHGWQDNAGGGSPADWVAEHHRLHENMFRFMGNGWFGMNARQTLDFMDGSGIVVRRSGALDGEGAGYRVLPALFPNWHDQLLQEIKSERNHPSIMIWSIENEFVLINLDNFGQCDQWHDAIAQVVKAAEECDPTRPFMIDGGGAMKPAVLPVYSSHYPDGPLTDYPDLAYEPNPQAMTGRTRWMWDLKRPRFLGEDWYLTGNVPELCVIGGEATMGGKASTLAAVGKLITICQQGYRWADYGAWSYSLSPGDDDGSPYNSMSPRAVFCRQWDWTFASGAKVPRTMGIFNDTRYDDPITFSWSLVIGGKPVATDTSVHSVAPGTHEVFDLTLPMPTVTARTEGQWILTLSVAGKEVFKDTKDVSVLPPVTSIEPAALYVYDPAGTATAFLKQRKIAFTELSDLKTLPPDGKVLLIGTDALSPEDAASPRFAAYADEGRSVIVLEQKNPLKYQALPAVMDPAANEGRTAFLEDLDSPIAKGLQQNDFFTWGPGEIVYRNAYHKPEKSARSLIECDDQLRCSALVSVPVGKGIMLLSQLVLEEKLADNAVAQQLLANLLNYGSTYKLQVCPVTLTTPAGSQFGIAAAAIGLQYQAADDPLAAIADPGQKIALITASPQNLAALAANQAKVDAFTNAGGWIIFNDLTPAGIGSYDKIVGIDHLIRPYGGTPSITNGVRRTIERVTFAQPRNPLTAGMTLGDIVQYSSAAVFPWTVGNFVSSDEFSYIVDYDDIAPFATSPFAFYGNITNGFTNRDGWPLIINGPVNADGSPFNIDIKLPRPESICGFTWVGDNNYYEVTKVNLLFDGKADGMATFNVHSDSNPMTFPIDPPRQASTVTLQLAAWNPPLNNSNYGIDNIAFKVVRSPEFYAKVKPMLNIGGMMEYPRGKGGIILCNLLFKSSEDVPVNVLKKRSILSTILRNLNAPFSGKTVIVGAHLAYSPIDISRQANQYRTDRGWFGDKNFTFADLPTGPQNFNGVQYDIYDLLTSPVPTCIMLGGPGVPNNLPAEVKGIPVNRKADALFFLQTARIDQDLSADEINKGVRPELFKYVIHYADGQTADAPVIEGRDVGNYRLPNPSALPGAALAWSAQYGNTKTFAAAWTQQWNNPRPDADIASIDLVYGKDKRAVPALLAITAATAQP